MLEDSIEISLQQSRIEEVDADEKDSNEDDKEDDSDEEEEEEEESKEDSDEEDKNEDHSSDKEKEKAKKTAKDVDTIKIDEIKEEEIPLFDEYNKNRRKILSDPRENYVKAKALKEIFKPDWIDSNEIITLEVHDIDKNFERELRNKKMEILEKERIRLTEELNKTVREEQK